MNARALPDVLAEWVPRLMALEGVEGAGEARCDAGPCIRVYVFDAAAAQRLPATIEGYIVEPVITGRVRPLEGG